ncbi:MAG: EAL domain-containing protein [Campylobacterota bacterium]|nr:EAL domain-containing protein [Campylobacterota bacterium]
MSMSKQLFIIISFIFFMIFTGNFFISVNNTKEYLETESITKAQDTATSLGMSLKPFMKDKSDPEIISIIKAIANRGFYKEIRVEDVSFGFNDSHLIDNAKEYLLDQSWSISNIKIDKELGEISTRKLDDEITNELALLEGDEIQLSDEQSINNTYLFNPSSKFKDGDSIKIQFTASQNKDDKIVNTFSELRISKIIAKEYRAEKFEYVPQWFIDMIPLNMPEMKSEISDGWNTTAVIFVSANAGEAYAKLYEQSKSAALYATFAFIISILMLIVFLKFILLPLKEIETLAFSIAEGKFGIIKKIPWTTELKNVSYAMNNMSGKIEGVIRKLNKNLEEATKQLSLDPLTGLQLKQSFQTHMKDVFISKKQAFIFIVKVDDLGKFAKIRTNKEVDIFLVKFADILKNLSSNITAYRFFGSEFALIAEDIDKKQLEEIVVRLKEKINELAKSMDQDDIAHIGVTPFNHISTIPQMVSAACEAYEKSKLIGKNEIYIRDESDISRDEKQWRDIIFDIVNSGNFDVEYINKAYCFKSKEQDNILMEEAFTHVKENNGDSIPIGTFVAVAEKYDKIIEFDKAVIEKVISHIKTKQIKHSISINLSLDSVVDHGFKVWLKERISQDKNISSLLVFSVTSYAVAKKMEQFKEFIEYVHSSGAKVIIKRFESKFISLEHIKDFKIDYIRLARDYTEGIHKEAGKKNFVESMKEICDLLGIKLYAENIKDSADFNIVKQIGLYGTSR